MLGDLCSQVQYEPEGSWYFEFEDPVDPKRMLWGASVFPGGEVQILYLPTGMRLAEEPTETVSKLKVWLAKIRQAFVLSWSFAVIAGIVWRILSRMFAGQP